MTARRSDPSPEAIVRRSKRGARPANWRLSVSEGADKKAAPPEGETAIRLNPTSYFLPARNLAQRARAAAAILARAAALIFRRLRFDVCEPLVCTLPPSRLSSSPRSDSILSWMSAARRSSEADIFTQVVSQDDVWESRSSSPTVSPFARSGLYAMAGKESRSAFRGWSGPRRETGRVQYLTYCKQPPMTSRAHGLRSP